MNIQDALESAETMFYYIKSHEWQEIAAEVSVQYGIPLKRLLSGPMGGCQKGGGSGSYCFVLQDLCSHSDDYIWLYDRLHDAMSRYVLWKLLCFRLTSDITYVAAAAEREYKRYIDPDISTCNKEEALADSGGFVTIDRGEETADALAGAKIHIRHHRPKVAVGVYHVISDLWEIPGMMEETLEKCTFFIRHYQADQPLDTVFYAVPVERLPKPDREDEQGRGMETASDLTRPGIYVFPPFALSNVQLLKDRIVIPYVFYRHFGKSMTIVTKKTEDYPYLDYLKGARMDFITYENPEVIGEEEVRRHHVNAYCHYLLRHYTQMDILFLFGLYIQNASVAGLYKKLRPDGKIYLKMDANSFWTDRFPFKDPMFASLLSACDVISCESRKLQRLLSKKWPWRIDYISNGYYDFFSLNQGLIPYSEKENIILTVGRIGTRQKNNELLLEAFAKAADNLRDGGWKVRLVGSVEPEFQNWLRRYFDRVPDLANRIELTGPISDRQRLFDEYKRAKIFVLTSRWEGGPPNVYSEAAFCGCVPVVTDMDASDDMTDEGRLGAIVAQEDMDQLAGALTGICLDEERMRRGCEAVQGYAAASFDYDEIVERLDLLLRLS